MHTHIHTHTHTHTQEFSRKEIKEYEKMFKLYDTGNDHYIDLPELKYMMEKLDAAQVSKKDV
jgi:Ca2+-binding EF-hand superfamily protein